MIGHAMFYAFVGTWGMLFWALVKAVTQRDQARRKRDHYKQALQAVRDLLIDKMPEWLIYTLDDKGDCVLSEKRPAVFDYQWGCDYSTRDPGNPGSSNDGRTADFGSANRSSIPRPGTMVFSADTMQRIDQIAGLMRDYYEANKPLHWWQKRRVWDSCIADDLMLGLLSVATGAITKAAAQKERAR
jgi:hypothetical protein